MGVMFKSLYLAHGRSTDSQKAYCKKRFLIADNSVFILDNPRLKKVHNVLLDLKERPEPTIEDYFEADIYIAPNLAKNSSKNPFLLSDSAFSREGINARHSLQGQQDANRAVSGRHERANGGVQGAD